VTDSFNSIFCAETAHLNVHECCGPEKFTGCKLVIVPTSDGKLTVDLLKSYIVGFGDPHMAQPKVISITQSTELGTVYTSKEIKDLSDFAHKNGMLLHMDGARLCNAAAYLDVNLNDISGNVGVDVLSFGGTKNGMMFGDAVIFFGKKLSKNFEFIRKQGMHLTSKMRFISAQFEALLSNGLWEENATHANKMAQLLYDKVKDIPQIRLTQKVQANAVFAVLPKKILTKLNRWMCSFNTSNEDVMNFVETIRKAIKEY
jgi:threonine aldolase